MPQHAKRSMRTVGHDSVGRAGSPSGGRAAGYPTCSRPAGRSAPPTLQEQNKSLVALLPGRSCPRRTAALAVPPGAGAVLRTWLHWPGAAAAATKLEPALSGWRSSVHLGPPGCGEALSAGVPWQRAAGSDSMYSQGLGVLTRLRRCDRRAACCRGAMRPPGFRLLAAPAAPPRQARHRQQKRQRASPVIGGR